MPDLDTSVQYIKGVGEARAKALKKLGIETLSDLVSYFPRAYEDRTAFKTIEELAPGEAVCVRAMVGTQPRLSHIRKGLDLVKFRAVDETGSMEVTFFNQSYLASGIKTGENYVFFGRIGGSPNRPEMTNPVLEPEEKAGSAIGRIMPVYRLTAGISQSVLAKAVRHGLDACGEILPDPLPAGVRMKHNLAQSRFSYENVHFPASFEVLEIARRRLIFEELFVLTCSMAMIRRSRVKHKGLALKKQDIEEFYSVLPFVPTNAQKRAIDDAVSDMCGDKPMSRLIQGDVGSGKTVVSAACAWYAAKNGYQAAIMAPTEILAQQHFETFSQLFSPLDIKVELLKGGMTAKEKREVLGKLESGAASVIIGTHAIISDSVKFSNLGLVVADEQHRFGVAQRSALSSKGEKSHMLVMSATPIPRTLALIIYGDLDVSVIDELPPGRQPVETYAVGEDKRHRIYSFIRSRVEEGRQAYIVCPMIDDAENPDIGLKNVKKYAETLQKEVYSDLSVALLHGKMKPKEKDAVMSAFQRGETDILVSTTVIEVGVDVPNATVMVVENADRFGLSQLHQLRGRVGRGKHKSYCILFSGGGGDVAIERLKAMCRTNDGFEIAETDLKLRGPGDFFGERQHGLPRMKIADLASDMEVLYTAQSAAKALMEADPLLESPENKNLRAYVIQMLKENSGAMN